MSKRKSKDKRYSNDFPSVTEVTSLVGGEGLCFAYGKLGISEMERRKRISAEIGQKIHKAIALFLTHSSFAKASKPLSNDQKVMFSHLVDWVVPYLDDGWKADKIEQAMTSEAYEVNGTPDLIMVKGTKKMLVDWKTDSVPKAKKQMKESVAKYLWQAGGYDILEHGVSEAHFVRADKNLGFQEFSFSREVLNEGSREFLKLREIYKRFVGK